MEASPAQALAQDLEAQRRAGELEGVPSLVQRLDTKLERLMAFWAEVHVTATASAEPF